MNKYTIPCTKEQTKRALELGAPITAMAYYETNEYEDRFDDGSCLYIEGKQTYAIPTVEQMIGFILDSGRGCSTNLSELIREQGYKQGCLTFIDTCFNMKQEEKICGNCVFLKGTFCKYFGEYREPHYEHKEHDCFEPRKN